LRLQRIANRQAGRHRARAQDRRLNAHHRPVDEPRLGLHAL